MIKALVRAFSPETARFYEAVEGCLSVDLSDLPTCATDRDSRGVSHGGEWRPFRCAGPLHKRPQSSSQPAAIFWSPRLQPWSCPSKAEALDSVRELAGTMIEAAQALSIIASDR
ncbi:hypothetical protein THSYN_09050 [Candidatus Thiodictyon syntrophicum]|jgi:hypothetical protein|uniref:Uncharacterized protein n=1 Tax=Candidatus Thiodictyon syntrophicum TaxID=1166950 RepID=A0A2K8U670_9GAMM|nr:hypothetical protein THSYN_09050 [Candidatus Thiodictyon syntrophicum]